jgi:hypothetical protein
VFRAEERETLIPQAVEAALAEDIPSLVAPAISSVAVIVNASANPFLVIDMVLLSGSRQLVPRRLRVSLARRTGLAPWSAPWSADVATREICTGARARSRGSVASSAPGS